MLLRFTFDALRAMKTNVVYVSDSSSQNLYTSSSFGGKSETHSEVRAYLFFLTNRFSMKSLASLEISSNASSSKSQAALVIFARVSGSLSPANGERPDRLKSIEMNVIVSILNRGSIVFIDRTGADGTMFLVADLWSFTVIHVFILAKFYCMHAECWRESQE